MAVWIIIVRYLSGVLSACILHLCLIKQFNNPRMSMNSMNHGTLAQLRLQQCLWDGSRTRGILQPTSFINRYSGGSRAGKSSCCTSVQPYIQDVWKRENIQQHHLKTNFKLWYSPKQLRIILKKSSSKLTILYSNSITVNAWIIEYECPSLAFNKEVQTRSVWFLTAGQMSLPSQLENRRKEVLLVF